MDPTRCRATRHELNSLLERSEFGAKEAMYNEYFIRGKLNETLCKTCSRQIQEHDDAVGAGSAVVSVGVPVGATAASPLLESLGAGYPQGVFTSQPVSTVYSTVTSRLYIFAAIFELIIAAALTAAFVANGVYQFSGGMIFIGPVILTLVAVLLFFIARTVVTVVDLNAGTIGAATYNPLCSSCSQRLCVIPVSNITTVTTEYIRRTNYRRLVYSVEAVYNGGQRLELERVVGGLIEASAAAQKWLNLINDMKNRNVQRF